MNSDTSSHDPTTDPNFQKWYFAGTPVWIHTANNEWSLGKVANVSSKEVSVQVEGMSLLRFDKDAVKPFIASPERMRDTGDMATLPYINEPNVFDCLSARFGSSLIYTSCGIVLVALNPNSDIDNLYSEETMLFYHRRDGAELPPHLYKVAEESYQTLRATQSNQSIIISGESGAGKTVSAKHVLRYLAHVSGVKEDSKHVLEKQIMASNPLLESFGNAKTARNDNSSRFGKYLMLEFNGSNKVVGAKLNTYLLEKFRVSHFPAGERSFHIFYQVQYMKIIISFMSYILTVCLFCPFSVLLWRLKAR